MLDPREGAPGGRRTLLAGALAFLVAGAALAYAAVDWERHGCRCDESLYPDWAWAVVAALSAAALVTAATLVVRAVRR
jgi:hypothetical protein